MKNAQQPGGARMKIVGVVSDVKPRGKVEAAKEWRYIYVEGLKIQLPPYIDFPPLGSTVEVQAQLHWIRSSEGLGSFSVLKALSLRVLDGDGGAVFDVEDWQG